jgi:hypothetical protein
MFSDIHIVKNILKFIVFYVKTFPTDNIYDQFKSEVDNLPLQDVSKKNILKNQFIGWLIKFLDSRYYITYNLLIKPFFTLK